VAVERTSATPTISACLAGVAGGCLQAPAQKLSYGPVTAPSCCMIDSQSQLTQKSTIFPFATR
jgi:hypothetical protein